MVLGSIIYPFPLVNATSQSAIDSMAFWSSPSRTDPFGLHLKLGYSKKCWAYLSSDLGHIHLLQGNHSGALRVLRAMVDNASPTVGESSQQPCLDIPSYRLSKCLPVGSTETWWSAGFFVA